MAVLSRGGSSIQTCKPFHVVVIFQLLTMALGWRSDVICSSTSSGVEFIKRGSRGAAAAAVDRLLKCINQLEFFRCFRSSGEKVAKRCIEAAEISRLPESILVLEIFCRLPAVGDVTRAQRVCKYWNSLLGSSEFRDMWHERRQLKKKSSSSTEVLISIDKDPFKYASLVASSDSPSTTTTSSLQNITAWRPAAAGTSTPQLDQSDWILKRFVMASSHGLVCWVGEAGIRGQPWWKTTVMVGNPGTGNWKDLSFPADPEYRLPWRYLSIRSYSVRFLHHDLAQQTYKLFLRVTGHDEAFLYDSSGTSSNNWQRLDRRRLVPPLTSAVILSYRMVHMYTDEPKIEMEVYDAGSKSWDEIIVDWHGPQGFVRIVHVFLPAADCKEAQHCRVMAVDGEARLSLWELDIRTSATFRRIPKSRSAVLSLWGLCNDRRLRPTFKAYVIRSDDKAFMAIMVDNAGRKFWLTVYDVAKSSWRTDAHGTSSQGLYSVSSVVLDPSLPPHCR